MPHLIHGQWTEGQGPDLVSINPTTGEPCWQGRSATDAEVDRALTVAREALPGWAELPPTERIDCLNAFADHLKARKDELAEAISIDTGKPRWESRTEVDAMIAKVPTTVDAQAERQAVQSHDLGAAAGVIRYKPHGVLVVFGPFNFPGHIANGHIVPALLAGNSVVFKPSELTPLVAEKTLELWLAAGLPPGVLNLLQGARETGVALTQHPGHDGILFTGSLPTGLALRKALVDRPEKILALELGGNNPLIVHEAGNGRAAALATIQSAYITAGQRCTAARRLIVPEGAAGDAFLNTLVDAVGRIRIGPYTAAPEPFAGPVISREAAEHRLSDQNELINRGGRPLIAMQPRADYPTMLTPGLIDVTAIPDRQDTEIFGPLLQLIRVPDFDAALREANHTAYGLVAGLLSDNRDLYDRFFRHARAGLVNWNRPTTGASSRLPFGGIKRSGNHRPSGYFAIDYCAHPVASLEADRLALPETLPPGIDL